MLMPVTLTGPVSVPVSMPVAVTARLVHVRVRVGAVRVGPVRVRVVIVRVGGVTVRVCVVPVRVGVVVLLCHLRGSFRGQGVRQECLVEGGGRALPAYLLAYVDT